MKRTQAEMRRHMQEPEMQAIFAELRERLNQEKNYPSMKTIEIEEETEELTEREKKQMAFGEMLIKSKRELQAEARREYEENPAIRAIYAKLMKRAQDAAE